MAVLAKQNAVAPAATAYTPSTTAQERPRHTFLRTSCCMAYVIGTVAVSGLYLVQLEPSASNDYWWPQFNHTGLQAYLGDVYNAHLSHGRRGDLPLLNHTAYMAKSYASTTTRIEWSASYGRQLLLGNLSLAVAVQALRGLKIDNSFMVTAQYCWLDLNRSFAMAHTSKRQARCDQHRRANAVVYLEPLFRNSLGKPLTSSGQSQAIKASILDALILLDHGQAWIDAMQGHKWLQIHDEVLHWNAHGLFWWKLPLQNLNHDGIEDSIVVQNALGYQQSIRIKKRSILGRGMSLWTTSIASMGIWNDLDFTTKMGASVLLDANNSVPNLGYEWDRDILGPPETVGVAVVRGAIGPFLSIDIELVAIPREWAALHRTFHAQLVAVLPWEIPAMPIAPVPENWTQPGRLFYGGNPVCPFGVGHPYVQPSFGYYDDCTSQPEHSIFLTADMALFALFAMKTIGAVTNIPEVCALGNQASYADCVNMLQSMASILPSLTALMGPSQPDQLCHVALDLNLQFVQIASDKTSRLLVSQPLVAPTDCSKDSPTDPWSFFGWGMIYDWARGDREVYSFEGDMGVVTLMSQVHPERFSLATNAMDVPQYACQYIWVVSAYVSAVLCVVGVLVLARATRSTHVSNLLSFNRVVGSSWTGRPMLFIRGMTALIMMSTSPMTFLALHGGAVSTMELSPRHVVVSCLVAGEGTWVGYVVQDVLLPVTGRGRQYVVVSSLVAWLVFVALDVLRPVHAIATIESTCVLAILGVQLQCTSGIVEIGSLSRLTILSGISVAIPCLALLAAWALRQWEYRSPVEMTSHAVVPGAALAYFTPGTAMDPIALVMSGLLPCGHFVFDLKLWRVHPQRLVLPQPGDVAHERIAEQPLNDKAAAPSSMTSRQHASMTILGLVYMVAIISGSVSYLVLTKSTMDNDFWWPSFNSSGHQSFLQTWFNTQLLLARTLPPLQIDNPKHGDLFTNYALDEKLSVVPAMYPSSIQSEILADLATVVEGLRRMDSCLLPWIASAYCFVDFGQTWDMAVSAVRQQKCKLNSHFRENGAVYLETILRNANDWHTLNKCWGHNLDVAVFEHVQTTSAGRSWLDGVRSGHGLSVLDEVHLWTAYGIVSYEPQWQTYKKLGITEVMSMQNGFGLAYSLTLKKMEAALQLEIGPTSFRMQLPLSNLLQFVASNATTGISLVRQSPLYAFQNSSVEGVLVQQDILPSPLTIGFALTRLEFGPFGEVDMKRVSAPESLRSAVSLIRSFLVSVLGQNMTAYFAFGKMRETPVYSPRHGRWHGHSFGGGSILCGTGSSLSARPELFFLSQGACTFNTREQILVAKLDSILAHLLMGLRSLASMTATCANEMLVSDTCLDCMSQVETFLGETVSPEDRVRFGDLGAAVKDILQASVAVKLAQYIVRPLERSTAAPELSIVDLFESPAFDYFAWLYMLEWLQGSREVVAFKAASGKTHSLLSGRRMQVFGQVNPEEIPQNVAIFLRGVLQYMTLVLLAVATVVCVKIGTSRGAVEGLNMFQFNRVAGLVWIGRPFMLLRGLTALCLLSTAKLTLSRPYARARYTEFRSVSPDIVTTFLSSGEVGWFMYILNDLFSIATSAITHAYAWKAGMLVWFATFVWSFVDPVTHVVHVDRQCWVVAVDYAMSCHSGTFEIGRVGRLYGLLMLACVMCVACYAVERWRLRRKLNGPTLFQLRPPSLLLHASAQHHFRRQGWGTNGEEHLDQASAVLNGLFAVNVAGGLVIFDVKTWWLWRISAEANATTAASRRLDGVISLKC